MSAIGGMLGLGGGAGGSGFGGATGVTPEQLNTAYAQQQAALQQQQDFVNAVQAQRGLQNQSQVFNQLSDISQGKGPNPAQEMLKQQTGQNIAQQAALQAGQRGSSANAGLIARQAAQQGGALQQNAVGQGATMQAQQSMNALNSMGNLANTQVGQQQGALQGLNQYSLQGQGNLLNLQGNINNANTSLAGQRMDQQSGALGGLLNSVGGVGGMVSGLSSGLSSLGGLFSGGGAPSQAFQDSSMAANTPSMRIAKPMAEGGDVESSDVAPDQAASPQQFASSYVNAPQASAPAKSSGPQSGIGQLISAAAPLAIAALAEGGKVPALVSPGEVYLDRQAVKAVKKGANPIKVGEKIPGKPKHPGNDYRNDVIHKHLDQGGIVIPNKVTEQPKSTRDKSAEKFVSQYLAQGGRVDGMVIFRSKRTKK